MRHVPGLALLVLLAACGAKPADNPHEQFAIELSKAYEPYSVCVSEALKSRRDFDGQLAEMVVAKQLDGQLGMLALRYLQAPADAEGLGDEDRIEAARARLLALGRFGGGVAAVPPGPEDVRRTMAVIESMTLIAAATDVTCEVPEDLIRSMEKAQNEYL